MKLFILAAILVLSLATMHPVNQVMVDEIKSKATSWTPVNPEENIFAYKSVEEIKSMLGFTIVFRL